MQLTVLSVAYPLAPVSVDAVGGAEQVLAQIDAVLVARGHRSIVVACEGSRVAGRLVPIAIARGPLDENARAEAQRRTRAAIDRTIAEHRIDVVHLHGIDFASYLPAPGPPALATLHLPPSWYPREALAPTRSRTWVHCVSHAQHRACPSFANLRAPIENGVPVERFFAARRKRSFALALGRICPEKGFHVALDAAKRANVPLVIGGEVFPYPDHERYHREQIVPRLDANRRFVGALSFERKRLLLAAARCVLIPSLAPETSSLVAMEALASGTPVIAYPSGALAELIEPGRTGFLVHDANEMADAIGQAGTIDPAECQRVARVRFSAEAMTRRYLDAYRELIEAA